MSIKRIDIMVDLETLGKGNNPPVFQIAACAFDIETGEILRAMNVLANVRTFNNIEGDTLIWWLNTNSTLLTKLLNDGCENNNTEKDIIIQFVDWVNNLAASYGVDPCKVYLWGNGILFDNRIISGKCREYDVTYPIAYYSDRDMRTIVELASKKKGFTDDREYKKTIKNTGTAHDALDDVKYQIQVVCQAYKDLEI